MEDGPCLTTIDVEGTAAAPQQRGRARRGGGGGTLTAGVWAINARTGDALGLASNNDRFLLSLLASPRSHAELRVLRVWWPVRLKTSMRGTGGVHPSQPSRAGGEEGMCQLVGFALSDDTALEVDPVL